MFWAHFLVARSPSSVWNNCNIYRFGTHVFLAFCHCEAYSFAFPLQNVDLDKHISPRRSESYSPLFSVKWNPGLDRLDRHICARLQSSVEKWSQKNFCLQLSSNWIILWCLSSAHIRISLLATQIDVAFTKDVLSWTISGFLTCAAKACKCAASRFRGIGTVPSCVWQAKTTQLSK